MDPDELAATANTALKTFPQTDALSIDQFKDKQADAVNQLLGLVFALLALSVIVALLGHRQHARALGARAHARARHAARGRHEPAPGAPDGPRPSR